MRPIILVTNELTNENLHNNPAGNVLEHHTVAGFVGRLSSRSGSPHELLLEVVLVQHGEVCQRLFAGWGHTGESRGTWSEQGGHTETTRQRDTKGHVVRTADEREDAWHLHNRLKGERRVAVKVITV